MAVDTDLRASRRPHADPQLSGEARWQHCGARPSQRRGRDLVINFAQTRLGTLRYIFAITDSGPKSGAGGRETGRAPA
jgi:hypothetical protein